MNDTDGTVRPVDKVTLDIEIIQDWFDAISPLDDGSDEALGEVVSDLRSILTTTQSGRPKGGADG